MIKDILELTVGKEKRQTCLLVKSEVEYYMLQVKPAPFTDYEYDDKAAENLSRIALKGDLHSFLSKCQVESHLRAFTLFEGDLLCLVAADSRLNFFDAKTMALKCQHEFP